MIRKSLPVTAKMLKLNYYFFIRRHNTDIYIYIYKVDCSVMVIGTKTMFDVWMCIVQDCIYIDRYELVSHKIAFHRPCVCMCVCVCVCVCCLVLFHCGFFV